ncbi:MAG: hypothetical protein ACYDCC_06145, partial [Actinomycetota bacterium]
MSKRNWVRRLAAGLALSTVAVVATGSGAGAAGISTYSAQASGTTLALSVQLPVVDQLLAGVLANA